MMGTKIDFERSPMKKFLWLAIAVLWVGCASKKTSSEARQELESKWSDKVGVATKSDFIEQYGNAEWCQPDTNGETCRFYYKKGTKWMGDNKRDKKSFETFDEVVAEFDSSGKLKGYK